MSDQDSIARNYFYHLVFQLYPRRDPTVSTHSEAPSSSRSAPSPQSKEKGRRAKGKAKAKEDGVGKAKSWVPSRSADIFGYLPGRARSGSSPTVAPDRNEDGKGVGGGGLGVQDGSGNISSPALKTKHQPAQSVNRANRDTPRLEPQGVSSETLGRVEDLQIPARVRNDWRFSPVRIDSIDMAPTHETRARFQPVSVDGERVRSTEVGWGVVHLYREGEASKDASLSPRIDGEEQDTSILCIPAVPSYMTPNDFLGWLGEKTVEHVSHFRLVMTGRMNRYLVLMKFRDADFAKRWRSEWDGKIFAGMEPEHCNILFIKSIIFDTPVSADSDSASNFLDLSQDPFQPANIYSPIDPAESLALRPLPPPTNSLVELPSCPVCLERMDSAASGLLTILCQHTFHCSCLQKWSGSGCPVCRHVQPSPYLNLARPFGSSEITHDFCSVCDTQEDLWICLICGNVGCGRYKGGHAKEHWKDSAHCFALEIETQHVWDYAADSWVHRLIQTKGDAKLVEFPSTVNTSAAGLGQAGIREDMVPRAKLDGMGMEYMHLLTSQLESQRMYFEVLVQKAVDKATSASAMAESASVQASQAMTSFQSLQTEHEQLQSEKEQLAKERDRLKQRAEKSSELARKMTINFQEEKQVGKGLLDRITHVQDAMTKMTLEVKLLRADNEDLKEQNRDLGFFISSQEKLKEVGEELGEDVVEGTLSLPDKREPKSRKNKGKGKAV